MSAQPNTNTYVTALAAIKATPIGESGQYLQTAFFRDDRRHITLIRDGHDERFDNDHGAAELVRTNLPGDGPKTTYPLEFTGAVHDAATAQAGKNRDGEAVVKIHLLYSRGTAPSATELILSETAARQLHVQLSAALDIC